MLKKIVRYGNSSALVLDKAILELLNIREGSLVKIKTDGISLIITPNEQTQADQISPTVTPQDVLAALQAQNLKESADFMEKYQPDKKLVEEAEKAFFAIHLKYRNAQQAFSDLQHNEEYQHESALLAQQQTPPIDAQKYSRALTDLICKYIPEWRAYTNEISEVGKTFERMGIAQTEPKEAS